MWLKLELPQSDTYILLKELVFEKPLNLLQIDAIYLVHNEQLLQLGNSYIFWNII